jgi:O-antigen/teichoic acid export membrane protein
MLKTFFSDLKFYFFIKASASLFFLLSLKLYTNALNTNEYGVYSILLFIINLCVVFSSSWLSASAIRLFPEYKNNQIDLYNTVITTLGITLLVTVPFIVLLFFIIDKYICHLTFRIAFLAIIQIVLNASFLVFLSIFSAQRQLSKLTIYSFIQVLSAFCLSLFFLKIFHWKIEGIMLGSIISYAILASILFKNQYLASYQFYFNKSIYSQIISYGSPLLIFNILAILLISSDQLVLKYYGYGSELGAYAANYTLIDKSLTVITSLITVTYTPILFNLWENEGKAATYRFFKKIISIYFPMALFLISFFGLSYSFISRFILTEEYSFNAIVPYILLGSFFLNTCNIFSEILTLNKKTMLLTCCYILPVLINITGNFIFVPHYGVKIAAYMTSLSYFVLMLSVGGYAIFLIKKSTSVSIISLEKKK